MYDLFINNNFNVAKILGELFIPKSGEFFALLLVTLRPDSKKMLSASFARPSQE